MIDKIVNDIVSLGIYGNYYVVFILGNQMVLEHMVSFEQSIVTLPQEIVERLEGVAVAA